jgi:hypothetical protein
MSDATISTTKKMLLALAGILVLGIVLVMIFRWGNTVLKEQQCENSIRNARIFSVTLRDFKEATLKCPPKYSKITSQEQAEKSIAQDSLACAKRWKPDQNVQLFTDVGTFCIPCAVYTIEPGTTVNGIISHLATTPADSNDPEGISILQKAYNINIEPEQIANTQQTLTGGQDYVILFVQTRGNTSTDDLAESISNIIEENTGKTLVGGGVLIFGGAGTVGAALVLASNPIGWVVGGSVAVVAGGYATVEAVKRWLQIEEVDQISALIFRQYDVEQIKKMGCEIAPSASDYKKA